jgi:hypothetical protein
LSKIQGRTCFRIKFNIPVKQGNGKIEYRDRKRAKRNRERVEERERKNAREVKRDKERMGEKMKVK